MGAREEMQKEYEQNLDNLFVEDFKDLLMSLYKKHLSLNIKRGIAAKRRKNAQSK
ncbi:hypothetical protein HYW46_06535 [Candidatus Daviesbacteria bacterium]|nr:hypothetical protein [Candidatus Daviesbacteria bacterium]